MTRYAPAAAEQLAFPLPVAGLMPVSPEWANALLVRWGHYLGPCSRPFGVQAWTLDIESCAVAVAVSASTVSEHVPYLQTIPVYEVTGRHQIGELTHRVRLKRGELVELARLCADPAERWATRPMLRLWREVAAPRWPYWPVTHAVAYSQNRRHAGDIYRWDGWTKIADDCGSSGGGTWSRKRGTADAVHGKKSLWLWRYQAAGGDAA
jgi:hypothetical protein